jgi:hypothetical protein
MDQQNFLILITGGFNVAMVALLIWGLHLRAMRRARRFEMMHQERMMAMEKGIPLPELAQWEDSARAFPDRIANSDPRWTLITGVLSISVGAGIMATILAVRSSDAKQFLPLGLLPIFFGAACLLLYRLLRHGRK